MQSANSAKPETELVSQAVAWLKDRLPPNWVLGPYRAQAPGDKYADSMLELQGGGFHSRIAVEARQSLSPREATSLLPRLAQILQSMTGGAPVLVVAPWLSKRTQELLAAQSVNYVDLTGNALVRLDNPALYVEAAGAQRNPEPKKRGQAQLRGAKAARLIRLLADVRPPYGVRDLAAATGLAPGYVSRLLDTLYAEALVERAPRGPIESVDVVRLLRRWAGSYDVFKTNDAETFIAPAGVDDLLLAIGENPSPERVVLTGSVAASRLAPVTSPALLLAYCDSPASMAADLELLPADEGANVTLLKPFDPVVWERTSPEIGLQFVAPSQVVVDCLTGNGRMPAEGEAVLEWMQGNELDWRLPGLHGARRAQR